jgi:hypothetical protein
MKKRNVNKKLVINKTTIAKLDRNELVAAKGGAEIPTTTITLTDLICCGSYVTIVTCTGYTCLWCDNEN